MTTHLPWKEKKNTDIRTHLLDQNLNKNSNPLTLKQGALETVDSYSNVHMNVYIDGSAFRATINAVMGVLLTYPEFR